MAALYIFGEISSMGFHFFSILYPCCTFRMTISGVTGGFTHRNRMVTNMLNRKQINTTCPNTRQKPRFFDLVAFFAIADFF